MSIISDSDLALIVADVRTVIEDDAIGTTISYQKFDQSIIDQKWDPILGQIPSDLYSESSVSAFKGGYKPIEIEQSRGLIQKGDIKFIIIRSDVSGVLSTDDRIIETASNYQSATTYEIKDVGRDPLAICYFIQARAI